MGKPGPIKGKNYLKDRLRTNKATLIGHYRWCLANGRDVSWFKKEMGGLLNENKQKEANPPG